MRNAFSTPPSTSLGYIFKAQKNYSMIKYSLSKMKTTAILAKPYKMASCSTGKGFNNTHNTTDKSNKAACH